MNCSYGTNQKLQFKHLTVDQGLSHSAINAIIKDRFNFMWFAATHGLNKYDGYNFEIFEYSLYDSCSLPQSIVRDLYEDSQGILWIATGSGLSRYNREQNNFINYYPDSSKENILGSFVQAICEDNSGQLWVATTTGINLYNRKTDNFTQFNYILQKLIPSASMNPKGEILSDKHGNLWISNMQYGLLRFNIGSKTFKQYALPDGKSSTKLVTSLQINDDILWIGTMGSGLYKFNTQDENGGQIVQYKNNPKDPNSIISNDINSLFYESENKIWVGTINFGLELFNPKTGIFVHNLHDGNNPTTLNNNSIFSIYKDSSKNLWVGTYAGGVNVSYANLPKIELYRGGSGNDNSLNCNNVTSFIEDKKGNIWIGTDGGGLIYFNRLENSFTNFSTKNSNLNSDAIHRINYDNQGNLWLSAWQGGISKFNRSDKSFKAITMANGLPDDEVMTFIIDKKNRFWAGCFYSGLVLLDNEGRVKQIYNQNNSKLSNINIRCLYENFKGDIFVGTDGGLFIFNPQNESFKSYYKQPIIKNSLTSNQIFAITEQDTGLYWLGTSYGLIRFDSEKERFTYFLKEDGLPSNMIVGLIFDKNGKLWISTDKGLARMDINTKNIKAYSISDGLQGSLFNNNSVYMTSKHELFFGGTNGFNIINPDSLKENNEIPPIVFTDFQIFNKQVAIGKDSPLKKDISMIKTIDLSYKESVFSIGFAALSYEAPEHNNYAYKMDGFDNDWIYAGNNRTATYTNLSPGEYTFRVKASNNDGVWNEKGNSIQIFIHPPFWQMNWFRILVILIILSGVLTYHQMRVNSEKSRNKQLEEHVSERTKELKALNDELESFAYSVSHDLRTPLRTITGFTEIIVQDYSKELSNDVKQYFRKINMAGMRMGLLIEDLLKLTRIGRIEMDVSLISLSTLVHEVYDNYRLAEPERRVSIKIQPGINVMADKRLVRILLDNLIQNAWKYTKYEPEAQIEFGQSGDQTNPAYYIRDNGVGFDMNFAGKLFHPFVRLHNENEFEGTGIGLATVKRIVDRHNGKIWVKSTLNQGTSVFFTLGRA